MDVASVTTKGLTERQIDVGFLDDKGLTERQIDAGFLDLVNQDSAFDLIAESAA